jgi:signal transduction protein with GAF and PtsI domain
VNDIARGMKAFDHPPVRGVWRTMQTADDLPGEGVARIVAVVRDPGAVWLRALGERLVAIVCTTGTPRSHVGILAMSLGIPCVVAAVAVGAELPADGTEVEVDCSGADGVVRG